VFSHDALEFLVRTMGEDRVMLGSDYPYPLGEQHVGSLVQSHPTLAAGTRAKLLHSNAAAFFGLETGQPARAGSNARLSV
jgi:aminocarboxymuconate-semialdehyde decarboxylase